MSGLTLFIDILSMWILEYECITDPHERMIIIPSL